LCYAFLTISGLTVKEYFVDLFNYNHWANERSINALTQIEGKNERAFQIMGHILDAQLNWYKRINDPAHATQNFWNKYSIEDMRGLSYKSSKEWLRFIESLTDDGYKKKINYQNSKGLEFTNTILQILTHVTHHSSYHRGQIASLIRSNWGAPPITDYIVYEREFKK
jgi:uncharacterized damage-inducible protein DinB